MRSLFKPYANNKGADQPAHLHSLISTFIFLSPTIQVWSQTPEDRFSRDLAQMWCLELTTK